MYGTERDGNSPYRTNLLQYGDTAAEPPTQAGGQSDHCCFLCFTVLLTEEEDLGTTSESGWPNMCIICVRVRKCVRLYLCFRNTYAHQIDIIVSAMSIFVCLPVSVSAGVGKNEHR